MILISTTILRQYKLGSIDKEGVIPVSSKLDTPFFEGSYLSARNAVSFYKALLSGWKKR